MLSKRWYLNESINEIYLMNDYILPNVDISAENNRNIIRNIVDTVVEPQKLSTFHMALERAKKRLFRDLKPIPRKMIKPCRKKTSFTECLYFKPQRHIIGRCNIRRIQKEKQLKMEKLHRDRLLAKEKILAAAVRSMLYMRALMGLVMDY